MPSEREPLHLLGGAGTADHAQPLEACHLRRCTADGAGGTRHVDRLALLHPPDHLEADPGRAARACRAPRVQSMAARPTGSIFRSRSAEATPMLTPTELRDHPVALGQPRIAGGDNSPNGAAIDRRADPETRDVGIDTRHTPAHVRIDRHEDVPHERLAVGRLRVNDVSQFEVRLDAVHPAAERRV